MSELENLLYKLFSEYSVQGSTYNQSYLRFPKLVELCTDAKIFTQKFNQTKLQLALHSSNSRNPNISFSAFCDLLPRIAETRFPSKYAESPSLAFDQLVTDHLLPLSRSISERLSIIEQPDLTISESVTLIAHSLYKSFKEVYTRTFPWEIKPESSIEDISDKSLKGLEKVLREFDIYPTIINKTKVHAIWRDLVIMMEHSVFSDLVTLVVPKKYPDQGVVLTLSKFILFIYFCSLYSTQENLVNENSSIEKFLVLLERAQLSLSKSWKGVNLVPPPEVLSNIMQTEAGLDLTALDEQPLEESFVSEVSLDHEGINVIDKYYQTLQRIFSDYCAIGDPTNTKYLRNANFHKLLRDAGLLAEEKFNQSMSIQDRKIYPVDADLIYTRLTSSKRRTDRQGLMDFLQFLKGVEVITKKLFVEQPYLESLSLVIEENLLRLQEDLNESQHNDVRAIIDSLKEESVIEVLGIVHRSMLYFFRFYSDKNGKMTFEKFLKFCKDFDIFPDILPKSRLSQIFLTLSTMSEDTDLEKQSVSSMNTVNETSEGRGNTIDQHLFIEALAVVSCEVVYDHDVSNVERICFLIERMSQSEGPALVYKELGHTRSSSSGEIHDMLMLIKNRYPRILEHAKAEKPSFMELARQYRVNNN